MLRIILLMLMLASTQTQANPFMNKQVPKQSSLISDESKLILKTKDEDDALEQLTVLQAFQFDLEQSEEQLSLKINIAKHHKLYKEKLKISVEDAGLNSFVLPGGFIYNDPEFGDVEVLDGQIDIQLELWRAFEGKFIVEFQGCSPTLCYPPEILSFDLEDVPVAEIQEEQIPNTNTATESSVVATELNGLLWYFLIGIGLALTPCVFPMYPIISATVLGDGKKTLIRTFSLAFSYVQGMALVYSIVGLLVALVGLQFQLLLQHPVVLSLIAILFVVLAGGMFGFYTLQPPIRYQSKVGEVSQKQEGGSLLKSYFMGAISGLVASPCTTAPLVGILLVIAQSGDTVSGFFSLYFLSLGMGVPLILFALTGGKLIPSAGHWMNSIKITFGFGLLAMSVYFLSRFVPNYIVESLFGVLGVAFVWAVIFSIYFKNEKTPVTSKQTFYLMALLLVSISFVQIYITPKLTNQTTPTTKQIEEHKPLFTKVNSKDVFFEQIKSSDKPVILDLYAEWCSACIQYEKNTFSNKFVKDEFKNFNLIQVDLTKTTEFGSYIMDKYNVLGLPAILFFDKDGNEIAGSRASGYMAPNEFLKHIKDNKHKL